MSQRWFRENKIQIIVSSALFLCMAAGWISYFLFGRQLIKAIYEGNSITLLNRIIEAQARYPLGYYLNTVDALFFRIQIGVAALIFITISSPFFKSIKLRFRIILFFVFVFAVIYSISHISSFYITPDSTHYLSCAEHLQRGEGFYTRGVNEETIDEFCLTGIYRESSKSRPYTAMPPLYPILIFLVMRLLNTNSIGAALIVNRTSFSLLITLIYLMLVQIDPKKFNFSALFIATLLTLFWPFYKVFNSALSDITYTGFSVFAVFYLQRFYNSSPREETMIILTCSLLTALSLLSRYMGISVFLTGVMLIFLKNRFIMTRRKITNFLIFCVISIFPLLPWLWRNKTLTGFLDGANRSHPTNGLMYNFFLTAYIIATDFIFTNNKYVILSISIILLIAVIYYRKTVLKILGAFAMRYTAYVAYPFIYIASLIIVLFQVGNTEQIGSRYVMPTYPFLITMVSYFFYRIFNNMQNKMITRE